MPISRGLRPRVAVLSNRLTYRSLYLCNQRGASVPALRSSRFHVNDHSRSNRLYSLLCSFSMLRARPCNASFRSTCKLTRERERERRGRPVRVLRSKASLNLLFVQQASYIHGISPTLSILISVYLSIY